MPSPIIISLSSTFTLHMRDNGEVDDGKVWRNLCREKRVNIAYNNYLPYFTVDGETGEVSLDPFSVTFLGEDRGFLGVDFLAVAFFPGFSGVVSIAEASVFITW